MMNPIDKIDRIRTWRTALRTGKKSVAASYSYRDSVAHVPGVGVGVGGLRA